MIAFLRSNLLVIDLAKAEARMEERSPGVDYATTNPSKTDYPHATETPNPAGDQAQGKSERSLAGCCVLSGYATHIWSACKFPVTRYCRRSFNYNPRLVQRR